MKRKQEIWIGELIRCWEALAPTDDTTRKVLAELIGFAWQAGADESETMAAPVPEPAMPPPGGLSAAPPPPPPVAESREEPPPNPMATELPQIEVADEMALQAAEWDAVEGLQPPQQHQQQYSAMPPALFRPLWSRTIVTTMSSRRLPIGPVDGERLVRTMAALRPVVTLPRQPRWTTMKGLQLLLDKAPGMAPFRADLVALAGLFDDCIGGEALEKHYFFDSPLRGVTLAARQVAYRPPQPGVPVVAISDLGLGAPDDHYQRARSEEWLRLAQLLAARDSTLTVLLPWPAGKVDPGLRRHMAIVEWDRSTSATRVRRLLEQLHG